MFVANISDGICLYVSLDVFLSLSLLTLVLLLVRRLFPRLEEVVSSSSSIDLFFLCYVGSWYLYIIYIFVLPSTNHEQNFPRRLIQSVYVSIGWLFPSHPVWRESRRLQ